MSSKWKSPAVSVGGATLVPNLRFPEFQDAPAWKPISLRKASVPVDEPVGERKLTPVSISAGIGFVPQAEKFGRDISGNQYQRYTLVQDGDFVFNKGNSLKFPQGCIYLLQGWGQVAAPNVFIAFRLKDSYSNGFFQNCFEQNQHGKQLKKHITSGARSNGLLNISKETFFNVEIPTPSLPEQQKIAECLDSADALIAAQGRKVEALRAHKKGLMQQLFPQEGETQSRLRFPEFEGAGEWEGTILGRLSEVVRGGSPRPIDGFITDSPDGLNWLKIGDVDKASKYVTRTADKVRREALTKTRVVNPGDLILSNSMSFGRPFILKISTCIHDGWIAIRKINEKIVRDFLYYLILSPGSQDYFTANAAGSGVQNLNADIIKSLPVQFPSCAEQERIAGVLASLDDLIAAESQKLDMLMVHEKALMQQLFPSVDGDNS